MMMQLVVLVLALHLIHGLSDILLCWQWACWGAAYTYMLAVSCMTGCVACKSLSVMSPEVALTLVVVL